MSHVRGGDKVSGWNLRRRLLQNHLFGISELLRNSYITVGIAVQVVDVGLISHLSHIYGSLISLVKVVFYLYLSDMK